MPDNALATIRGNFDPEYLLLKLEILLLAHAIQPMSIRLKSCQQSIFHRVRLKVRPPQALATGYRAHCHQSIHHRFGPEYFCRPGAARDQGKVLRNIEQVLQGCGTVTLLPGLYAVVQLDAQLNDTGDQQDVTQNRHKP